VAGGACLLRQAAQEMTEKYFAIQYEGKRSKTTNKKNLQD
jgi:hypothetical protein